MQNEKSVTHKFGKRDIFITSGFIIAILIIVHVVCVYMNKQDYISPILNANLNDTKVIMIQPENVLKSEYNLVDDSITIDNTETKSEILEALNSARPYSSNHPKTKWLCILTLVKQKDEFTCKIYSSNKGILIQFYSYGFWGFNLGEYRSDSLGTILESITEYSKNKI